MSDIIDIGGNIPVAASLIRNMKQKIVFGDNATVGTSYETVSSGDATATQIAGAAGDNVDVVSADAADDGSPVGTGANTVIIHGIAASTYIKQQETITLNGTGAVASASDDYVFINEMYLASVGTGLASAGVLTMADVTNSNPLGIIEAGHLEMHNAIWMVPAGHTAYVPGFWGFVNPVGTVAGAAIFAIQTAKIGFQGAINSETWTTVAELAIAEADSDQATNLGLGGAPGSFVFPNGSPLVVPEKHLVRLACKSTSGATSVSGGFHLSIQGSGASTSVTDS